jgi:hypothetical protein
MLTPEVLLKTRRALALFGATLLLAAAALGAPAVSHADVTWLCHPGISASSDPCELPLDTTLAPPDGKRSVVTPARADQARRPVDCFYVYPTVSNQPGPNATKARDPEVVSETEYQAARFSSVCRMFTPLYRQVTVPSILFNGIPGPPMNTAYADVLEAWHSYLANDNDGRGVILIGHSQGSLLLRQLIRTEIDPDPSLRRRLVGAVLLGGQVTTRAGHPTGGDFQNVQICSRQGQIGCVVAFSTFPKDPDGNSLYGDSANDNLSGAFGEPHGPDYEVACTDPDVLSGDAGPFPLTVPTKPFAPGVVATGINANTGPVPSAPTTWVAANEYAGACKTINGHHVYRYDPVAGSPPTKESPPGFGTHLLDFNLGPDRLVRIAATQARGWLDMGLGQAVVRVNRYRGTAKLTIFVPAAGELRLTAPRRLRTKRATMAGPTRVTLSLVPTVRSAKRIRAHHSLRVTATIAYTAAGLQPITRTSRVRLVLRHRSKTAR